MKKASILSEAPVTIVGSHCHLLDSLHDRVISLYLEIVYQEATQNCISIVHASTTMVIWNVLSLTNQLMVHVY